MKKVLALLMALVLVLSLAACGEGGNVKSSVKPTESTNDLTDLGTVGAEVVFGDYYLSEGGDEEPLRWIVLDCQNGKSLVIAKYAIECGYFADPNTAGSLDVLANKIFTDEEKELIIKSNVSGKSENRYFFNLSMNEVEKYMPEKRERVTQATGYASSRGTKTYDNMYGSGCCNWILRDGHYYSFVGGQLGNAGEIEETEYNYFDDMGVRPAMWLAVS